MTRLSAAERPLVLLDPHPRDNASILCAADRRRLEQMAELVTVESGAVGSEVVDACLPRVVAILGQTPLPRQRIERAVRLRAVFNVEGNFLPNIDYAACFERGIRVACAAPAFARPVAEYALALALDLQRGISAADRAFRAGTESYGRRGNSGVRSLFGAQVGMLGFGNIARTLMPLLAPFGCRVRAFDPWLPDAVLREHGAEPAALDALLAASQLVFVLAAPTAANRHFIGAAELAQLHDGAGIVLLSRADVLDYDALLGELRTARIRAAIDVFPQEPLAAAHPLRGIEAACLSAHRAGGLESALQLIGEMAVDDLALVLRGLPPVRLQSAQPETVGLLRSRPGNSGHPGHSP
jgi:phosphoglycerate dehydrogenase-like enzyme